MSTVIYVRGYIFAPTCACVERIELSDNFICPDRMPSFTGFANLSFTVIRLARDFDKKVSPRVSCS